ncbi:N-terminal domain of NEFA-interacting nuclear protein NIP30-domain-containing protein, partial [Vararia minispora EC-137]
LPSLSSGAVGSRFVSQSDIEHARAKREEQWKAAYARLGQEPPPQPKEDVYDGRSLAEKLAANRAAKQEEWEEKNKLANQFRALEEDEIMFLDSVRERQEQQERERKLQDGEELKSFREYVLSSALEYIPIHPCVSELWHPRSSLTVAKKPAKPSLKGVVVKKK